MFHGGGGSKEDNLIDRIDPVLIAREALARGYTVASLDSVAHVVPNGNNTYQWDDDDSATNVDVVNVEAMIARLTDPDDLNAAPAGGPLVLVGISNGGSMASRVAQRVSIDAAVIYISNAVAFHDSGATIPPLVLVPGANDPGQALASNKTLRDSVEADGGDVLYIVNESDALTPGLFMRVDGVSCEMSKSIGLGLEAAQWLNADGTLANNPKSDHSWQSALPEAVAQYKFQISDVLVEAYAEHAPSSDQNAQVFDFLADLQ